MFQSLKNSGYKARMGGYLRNDNINYESTMPVGYGNIEIDPVTVKKVMSAAKSTETSKIGLNLQNDRTDVVFYI